MRIADRGLDLTSVQGRDGWVAAGLLRHHCADFAKRAGRCLEAGQGPLRYAVVAVCASLIFRGEEFSERARG